MAVIKTAGAVAPVQKSSLRKDLLKELSRRIRAAQTDDEHAEAIEALVEFSRTSDEE